MLVAILSCGQVTFISNLYIQSSSDVEAANNEWLSSVTEFFI